MFLIIIIIIIIIIISEKLKWLVDGKVVS